MVVLDADQLQLGVLVRALLRVPRSRGSPGWRSCAITRGSTAKRRSKCSTPSRKELERLPVLEVADVVRRPRAAALGNAERALELGAAAERRRCLERQTARSAARSRASGASSAAPAPRRRGRPSRRCACGSARSWTRKASAISPSRSRASSSSYAMGSSETLADVMTSARPKSREQHVLKRRVGKHHAEVAGERRHRWATRAPSRRRAITIGRSRPEQELLLVRRQLDQGARLLDARRHQRERLLLALLARPAAQPTASSDAASQARW